MGPADLLREVIKRTEYFEYLNKDKDAEMRHANVDELVTFATEAQEGFSMFDLDAKADKAEEAAGTTQRTMLPQSSTSAQEVIEIVDSDEEDARARLSASPKGKQKTPGSHKGSPSISPQAFVSETSEPK
jgi:superfamily I DNA/RNA helicase